MPVALRVKKARIHDQAETHDTRLIDKGALGLEASISGRAERYGRGKTSHTIHVWWARRPHGVMRALTFASLMPEGGSEGERIVRELAFAASADATVVGEAQRLLKSQYGDAPKVLDVFGGGGTIPYEAALLGTEVFSLDYNPLSVFIQKANLEFAHTALSQVPVVELVGVVADSGKSVLETLRDKTEDLFPLRRSGRGKGVFAYFWSYRLQCGACGYDFLLMKRPWLSRKAGRHTVLSLSYGRGRQSIAIEERGDEDAVRSSTAWLGRTGTACCPKCSKQHKAPSIKNCSDALLAIAELSKRGKTFGCAPKGAVPSSAYLDAREKRLLKTLSLRLPDSRLPRWSGIVNASLYGIDSHSDFLNKRQRVVLLELLSALTEEHKRLRREYSVEIVQYVVATLSALIDQLVDWNCRLSMWISQNEQVGRAFCGPGVPMLWDYVETDPLLSGPANLWRKLDRIVAGVRATPRFERKPTVFQGRAQSLPFSANEFDAVITDPPYYDNVYYNVLADFFYAWKRPLLRSLCPDLFNAPQCAEENELVCSQFRHGDHATAHNWYCTQLTKCLKEVARVLKPDGILSFVFGHSSLWGWEAIVRSFRASGLVLTSAVPLSIERRQRPRAMTSEAVNTCIVLVGRKSREPSPILDIGAVEESVGACAGSMAPRLQAYGWQESDIGMAIFAQGVIRLANAARVTGVDSDAKALQRIGELVQTLSPAFKLQVRQSL